LANRALDPTLPRLLQRDPERLLDRLTLLLTDPRGTEMIPAMARLLRTIGVPVMNLLETRLYEARGHQASSRGGRRPLTSWPHTRTRKLGVEFAGFGDQRTLAPSQRRVGAECG